MTLESHIPPLILGCGALAGVQKEPGSLGFARYDTRKDPKNVTLTTVGRGTGLLGRVLLMNPNNLTPNPFPSGKGDRIVGGNLFPSGKGDKNGKWVSSRR